LVPQSSFFAAEPKCPQGRAYVDYSGKFLQCGEGIGGNACPANYECIFDGLIHGCCPSKAYTCSLQVSKGVTCGSGSSYRFYYNNQLKECQSFLFLGCDGNSNNFPSAEKCQNYCEIAVCPNGGSPLRMNQKLRTCSTSDPCPSGYECSQVDSNGVTQRRCCPTKNHTTTPHSPLRQFHQLAGATMSTTLVAIVFWLGN
ncbi:Kunitz/Bovine pancreatic trypsin inhibitor domain protein, partial [Cooperia oncophora]